METSPVPEALQHRNINNIVLVPVHAELHNLPRLLGSAERQNTPVHFRFLVNDLGKNDDRAIAENKLTVEVFQCVQARDKIALQAIAGKVTDETTRQSILDMQKIVDNPNISIEFFEQHSLPRVHYGRLRASLLRDVLANIPQGKAKEYAIYMMDADAKFPLGYFAKMQKEYSNPSVQTVFTGYDLYPGSIQSDDITQQTKKNRLENFDEDRRGYAGAHVRELLTTTGNQNDFIAETPQISFTADAISDEMLQILEEKQRDEDYSLTKYLSANTITRHRLLDNRILVGNRQYATADQIEIDGKTRNMKLGNNSNSALQESIKQQQEFKQREKSYSRIQDMLAESNVNIQALERFVALINSDQEAKEAIRQLQKAATSITGVNSILTQREYREHIRAFQRVLAQEQSNGEVVMLEGKKRTLFEGLKNASDSILPIQPKLTSELFNEINNHLAFLDGKQTARSTSENDKEKRNLNLTMQYNRLLISLQAIETQSGDTLTLNKGKFQEDMAKFIQTFKATLEHEYQAMQHDLNYKELSNSEFRTRALTQITDKARFEELRSRLERQEKIEKAKRTRLLQAYVYGEEGDKRLETIQDILPIFEEIFSDEIALIDSMKQQSIPEQEILSQILSDPRYTNFFQYTQHDSDLTFWRAFEQALLEEKQSRKE